MSLPRFDQVSITHVAEAAQVSRRTLFAYFPAKEDLSPPASSATVPLE
ncbi:TetR family transcriptional regulator [Nonomuraea sp. 3N208]